MKAVVFVALVALTSNAWSYGEDVSEDDHSTAHYDMAHAMARCAGFTADDARRIAEADEVTDTHAYGSTAFEFPSREGVYKSYFHFPEADRAVDGVGDGPLRDWANGAPLAIGACDAAGTCCDSSNQCVTAGSPEAIGIWQHSVADYWSHHACVSSGGVDHGHFDAANADQAAYCDQTMHSHEWGRRDTTDAHNMMLQANAIQGLRAMRDSLGGYASEHGLVACGAIADAALVAFASQTSSALRIASAATLYGMCDAACPAAAGDAGTAIHDPPPAGCGCTSTGGAEGALCVIAIGLVLRRRRDQ